MKKPQEKPVGSSVRVGYVSRSAMIAARMKRLAWWRAVMCAYPGGVVPIATAARILGVTRPRVRELIGLGQLPVITGMPDGHAKMDKFVPLDALLGAPTPADIGRQSGWNQGQDYLTRIGVGVNPWVLAHLRTLSVVDKSESVNIPTTPDSEQLSQGPIISVPKSNHLK